MPRLLPVRSRIGRLVLVVAGAAALGCSSGDDLDDQPDEEDGAAASAALDSAMQGRGGVPALSDTALVPGAVSPIGASAGGESAGRTRVSDGALVSPMAPDTAAAQATAPSTATTPADTEPAPAPAPPPVPAEPASPAGTPAPVRRSVPFAPGERFTYEVRFGPLRVGSATMEVVGIEEVRGQSAYHTRFRVRGSALGVKVDDRYESWMDVGTLASLRHVQDVDEGTYERKRSFEIFPDRQTYTEQVEGRAPREALPSVANPLDEGSFIYFIRSMPELEIGKSYTFNNYFRPDRNPVRITVLRRERIEVPAGKFDALVIRPSIKTRGLFSEGGRAEIWLADDSTRALLQLKTKLPIGSLNLYLNGRNR